MADEHTSLPWFVEASTGEMDGKARFETGSKVLIYSDDCPYHPVADCSCNHSCRMPGEQEDNAAFIVKAVNGYDATQDLLVDIWFHLSDTTDPTLRKIADRARALIPDPVGDRQ